MPSSLVCPGSPLSFDALEAGLLALLAVGVCVGALLLWRVWRFTHAHTLELEELRVENAQLRRRWAAALAPRSSSPLSPPLPSPEPRHAP
jgi:hypothetical protein